MSVLHCPFAIASLLTIILTSPSTQAQLPQLPLEIPLEQTESLETGYILGAGDRVALEVFNIPEYSQDYSVLLDGSLNLPLIGRIAVTGLTVAEAEAEILRQYRPILTRPILQLHLVGMRPLEIGVVGEVTRPGAYQLLPNTNQEGIKFPTVTQALQLADGVTPAAALQHIEVRRQHQGREETIAVDLGAFFQNGDLQQDISLRDGDTIIVPAATEIDAVATRVQSRANFAADRRQPITVAVVGAVNRPGSHTLNTEEGQFPQDASLTHALRKAGGIAPTADIRRIQIRRRPLTGEEQTLTVNLWALLQTGDLSQDLLLQDGDTAIVPHAEAIDPLEAEQIAPATFAPDRIRVNVVGEVVRPGELEVAPNTSLEEAFFAAGGFDHGDAETGSMELIRLNANGTLSRQTVAVDLSAESESDDRLTLLEGDAIVVRRDRSLTDSLGTVFKPLVPVLGIFDLLDGLF